MSAILTILGRATRDPEMQQGKNSGTEYVSLDIAVSQRGQDGKEETIYYQCYFNKFLAERLAKAGVKKGDRKSTRLNSSHSGESRMPSSA